MNCPTCGRPSSLSATWCLGCRTRFVGPGNSVQATTSSASRAVGDSAGEHELMERGEGSAWGPVLLAFALNTFAVAYLLDLSLQVYAERPWPFGTCVAVGGVASLAIFFNRFRCIEAFTSRDFDSSAVTRVRLVHATLNALLYAWRRGLMKLVAR